MNRVFQNSVFLVNVNNFFATSEQIKTDNTAGILCDFISSSFLQLFDANKRVLNISLFLPYFRAFLIFPSTCINFFG